MSIFSYVKSHVVFVSVVTVAVIIVAIIGGRAATQKQAADNTSNESRVTLVNAATFRKGTINVQADGTVEAHSQADLKSQISAPVSAIYASIGDTIYAGQTILELQNADIRAQLAQAQASLILAQGQYGTTRQSAIDKVKSAYLAADSAIHAQIDQLIINNNQPQPVLFTFVSDPQLSFKIKEERGDMNKMFTDWKPIVDALSATSTDAALYTAVTVSQTDLSKVSALLDDISTGLNTATTYAVPSTLPTLNNLLSIVNGARSSIVGANAALTSAATAITDPSSGTSPAQAQVSVAQAGVNNLKAQLAKTIITSPITGKISALPLREGELASPGALLATVVGDTSQLEVKAFVSGDDLSRLKLGQPVTIGGAVSGTVSNISPSVDPTTKKAEVDVDVSNSSASKLVIGQNVSISIATANPNAAPSPAASNEPVTYILPIQDVKIIPGAAYVFTVDADSKIKRNPVTLGTIQGDFVEIVGGMTDSMNIVTPVYELDEGQTVQAQ